MKKLISLFLVLLFTFSLTACKEKAGDATKNYSVPEATDYEKAVEFIEDKNYQEAYDLLLTISDDAAAQELLSKFAFLVTEANDKGYITQYTYDENGKLISRKDSDGEKVYTDDENEIREYDENGNMISVTNSDGEKTTYTYDENGNILSISDKKGNTTYEYNEKGLKIKECYDRFESNQETHYYTYDKNDKLIEDKYVMTYHGETVFSESTQNTYDENGNLLHTKDTKGNEATYTYDENGNLIKEETFEVADWGGEHIEFSEVITYTYDANGNLIKTEGASERKSDQLDDKTDAYVYTYTYDEKGRLTAKNFGEGKNSFSYSYDEYGNVTEVIRHTYRDEVISRIYKLYYFPNGITEDLRYVSPIPTHDYEQ